MKYLKEYTDNELRNLSKDLISAGFEKPLPRVYLNPSDFFDGVQDHDLYVDVSGPSVEMAIDQLIEDYQERIQAIPKHHRSVAGRAIKELWKEKIGRAFK